MFIAKAAAAASTNYFYSLYRETGAFRRSAYSWRIVGPLKMLVAAASLLSLPISFLFLWLSGLLINGKRQPTGERNDYYVNRCLVRTKKKYPPKRERKLRKLFCHLIPGPAVWILDWIKSSFVSFFFF
jgi:hypothetical protein